jgi:methyltransferase
MMVTHVAFFVLTPLEILLLDRRFLPALGLPMIGLFLLAMLLRWWATSLLKEQWSSRVVVPEDLEPVTSGPYRVLRHPNYLAVSVELLAAGLIYSAFLSTAVVGVLHCCAIVQRIHTEEEVLFQIPAYRTAMAHKPRLIPGIY